MPASRQIATTEEVLDYVHGLLGAGQTPEEALGDALDVFADTPHLSLRVTWLDGVTRTFDVVALGGFRVIAGRLVLGAGNARTEVPLLGVRLYELVP